MVTFTSYFGGVRCIDWSADGRYLLAGGEDDCVTVWSLEEQRQVARCSGHSSWVSAVRFIPPSTEKAQVILPILSLFTLFRPYLAHFCPVFPRFCAWPRRFQRAPSRNPEPRNSRHEAQEGRTPPFVRHPK